MEHKNFQNIADDALVVDWEIELHWIHFCYLVFDVLEDVFFPERSHDEVVDEYFKFIFCDTLFEYKLIIFHDGIDVKLHVEFLHILILFEPEGISIVFDIELNDLPDDFFDFFLM